MALRAEGAEHRLQQYGDFWRLSEELLDMTGKGIRRRQLTTHEPIREASHRT
jgi:hypothetical protein